VNGGGTPSGERRRRRPAWIGIGANLGDPAAALRAAFTALSALPRTRLLARSSIYRSAPIDAGGPDYLNAVAQIATGLTAPELLAQLQSIEKAHGRERPFRNAPRTLDLDLLLYGGEVIAHPHLVVPHPRMQQRAFVLVPLAELAPEMVIPGLGPIGGLLPGVAGQAIERLAVDSRQSRITGRARPQTRQP
jgi:2-amino-4-hydroxy-6-hydroxymethyldihydropteridine diphosphokinase